VEHDWQAAQGARIRSAEVTLQAALATVVVASAAPYGYTITLWSSGGVLVASLGAPTVAEVLAFAAGALAGFGFVARLAHGTLGQVELVEDATDRVVAGSLHLTAVGGAIGIVALIAQLGSWPAWPLGSFVATTFYLLVGGLQLAAVARRRRGSA